MEIRDIKNNFEKIRGSKKMWEEFAYLQPNNYMKRYALAIQLQYNCSLNDKELVKFLMENEIKDRENDPFQGVGDSLFLLSYLLAKFKDVSNVWLFERAKCANFDTACGYDERFIFSAGVDATCNYIKNFNITEDNRYIYENRHNLDNVYKDTDIVRLFKQMKQWFPDKLENEKIDTLLIRSIDFEDYDESKRLFEIYEKTNSSDIDKLFSYSKDLKEYNKAISYQKKIFEKADNAWDKVSSLLIIANLHCLSDDYCSAFQVACHWDKILYTFDSWKNSGLGRKLTESLFDICLGLCDQKNKDLAHQAFEQGDRMVSKIESYHYNLLKKANRCCENLPVTNKIRYYKKLLKKEEEKMKSL